MVQPEALNLRSSRGRQFWQTSWISVKFLKINVSDRGLAHLDFHYSYGLSVVTSHLAVGASLGFPTGKFTDRAFWDDLRKLEATHLPGVPFHYEMMNRLGIRRLKIPSVTVMTQAGGRLSLNVTKASLRVYGKCWRTLLRDVRPD